MFSKQIMKRALARSFSTRLQGAELETALSKATNWKVNADETSISREFQFGDFKQAFSFMTRAALKAEDLNHHPEWFNVYNNVNVTLTTHDVSGLSKNDFEYAEYLSTLANHEAEGKSHRWEEQNVQRADTILDTIGNTPHVRLTRLFPGSGVDIWVKNERANPGGSIKDRIALSMVEDAERSGLLQPGGTIIEPTSGNTGVGLAMVAAAKGYTLKLCMPESMSIERRRLMKAYGAEFVLTPKELGMKGAIAKAEELAKTIPGSWMPNQFNNEANVAGHIQTTAQEILSAFPEGLDYLITGVGTGGHLTGVAKVLREKWPDIKIFAVEPVASPVISGGDPSPHPIQGIGAGFIPQNLDTTLLTGVLTVDAEDSKEMARRSATQEGILVGISSGATLQGVAQELPNIPRGSKVLAFNYDTGERYFSVDNFLPVE